MEKHQEIRKSNQMFEKNSGNTTFGSLRDVTIPGLGQNR